ncbi:hypothetical protein IAG25_39170, partial [Caballeronia sp. EK]|nr:hypothetical protein [Caballeronia sp. EK]
PNAPNEVWSINFEMDSLASGRRLKCLTIVDDFTKETLDMDAQRQIDNGSEFFGDFYHRDRWINDLLRHAEFECGTQSLSKGVIQTFLKS